MILAALAILAAAAVVWVRRGWLVVTVDGMSMAPTHLAGDRLLVRRAAAKNLGRGMIVVIRQADELMVKRICAVPGDQVMAGIPVAEDRVPPDCYLVLGDNAEHSYDSRRFGYLCRADLVGVVVRPLHTA